MQNIQCPNCQTSFQLDESQHAAVLQQIRDGILEEELHKRLQPFEKEKEQAVQIAIEETKSALQKESSKEQSQLNVEIARLKTEKDLAVNEATSTAKAEIDDLKNQIQSKDVENKAEIDKLKFTLKLAEKEKEQAVNEAISTAKAEIDDLKIRFKIKMLKTKLK